MHLTPIKQEVSTSFLLILPPNPSSNQRPHTVTTSFKTEQCQRNTQLNHHTELQLDWKLNKNIYQINKRVGQRHAFIPKAVVVFLHLSGFTWHIINRFCLAVTSCYKFTCSCMQARYLFRASYKTHSSIWVNLWVGPRCGVDSCCGRRGKWKCDKTKKSIMILQNGTWRKATTLPEWLQNKFKNKIGICCSRSKSTRNY